MADESTPDIMDVSMSTHSPVKAAKSAAEIDPAAKDEADVLKNEGNKALQAGDYETALAKYSDAIAICEHAVYYSNRAMVHNKLKEFEKALADAEASIRLDPAYWKGHSRKITALHSLERFQEVIDSCNAVRETCQCQCQCQIHNAKLVPHTTTIPGHATSV